MGQSAATVAPDAVGFALALYRHHAVGEDQLLLSPVSVSLALRTLHAGARGETAAGIMRALSGGGAPTADLADPDRFLVADGNTLSLAIGLWLDRDLTIDPGFVQALSADKRIGWFDVAFADTEATRARINQWTEERTNQLIKDLIGPGLLSGQTRLVATSAVHFRDRWSSPFNPEDTTPAPFRRSDGTRVEVPMMRDVKSAAFARNDDACMLELEYRRGCVLHVFLPDSPSGLERLQERLTPDLLSRWIDALGEREVDLMLPRFRALSAYNLADGLADMGMRDAFDPERADFSGIGRPRTGRGLYFSAVIQKTFIEVDEVETQAAAAAAAIMVTMALSPKRPQREQFHADHPFLYMIRNGRRGSVLFIGRMTGREAGDASDGDRTGPARSA